MKESVIQNLKKNTKEIDKRNVADDERKGMESLDENQNIRITLEAEVKGKFHKMMEDREKILIFAQLHLLSPREIIYEAESKLE